MTLRTHLGNFRRDEDGAALVEFGLSLPLVLVLFAAIVDGSRMLWAYQAVSAGVRDAARYVARVAPRDICTTGGSLVGFTARLNDIVTETAAGTAFFPEGMAITSVTPSLTCVAGTWRDGTAPIAEVTAVIEIPMPFANVVAFAGGEITTITATVRDQSRIYGS